MANKQYKDFSAGAFAADQIIAQQSTSDDSYTKVTVPTFGFGDNVGNEAREFNFNNQSLDLKAENSDSGGKKMRIHFDNTKIGTALVDNDTFDHSTVEQFDNSVITLVANDPEDLYSSQTNTKESITKECHEDTVDDFSQDIQQAQSIVHIVSNTDSSIRTRSIQIQNSYQILQESSGDTIGLIIDNNQIVLQFPSNNVLNAQVSENRMYIECANTNFSTIQEYATNAAAITAGLAVGDVYHTAGIMKVVI